MSLLVTASLFTNPVVSKFLRENKSAYKRKHSILAPPVSPLPFIQGTGALLLNWRKLALAYGTKRTLEIFGKILESCSCRYSCLWYSYSWVILPTADVAYILFHFCDVLIIM